jgi:tetratricopeptide (TPR) repeat protein
MSYPDSDERLADLERAIERYEYSGRRESVRDILNTTAPKSSNYWYEIACELHRREMFYEALDCWWEAEKSIEDGDEESEFSYQDMIQTLIDAACQTEDDYFNQQALNACEKSLAREVCGDVLNWKLGLLQDLRAGRNEVLSVVEQILDEGCELVVEVDLSSFGINDVDSIEDYGDLAECYLELDEPSEALRIWSKAIKCAKDKNEMLSSVICTLNWYAEERGFDQDAFLPSIFERVTN